MLEFPGEGANLRKSAVFCESLSPDQNFLIPEIPSRPERTKFSQRHSLAIFSSQTRLSQGISAAGVTRKGLCRNPGEFCGGIFWGIFGGHYPWKKQEQKIHPKIHGKIQIRIWEICGQNPHCKNLPLRESVLPVVIGEQITIRQRSLIASLVTQQCDPPYRAIGYSWSRRVSRFPPPLLGV